MNYLAKYARQVAAMTATCRQILEEAQMDLKLPTNQKEDLTWALAKLRSNLQEAFRNIQEIETMEDEQ